MDLNYLFLQSDTPEILLAPLTFALIIITGLTSYQAMTKPELKYKLIFNANMIKQKGEWYRFWSHGLIHANWVHLALNLFVLYTFGLVVEMAFKHYFGLAGSFLYLLLYVLGIAAASIYSYYKHQDNYGYNALGASGAISGIVFAYILIAPTSKLSFLFLPFLEIPAIILGVGYLIYSHVMSKRGRGNIGHDAHFWGAVWGIVFTILLDIIILQGEIVTKFAYVMVHPELWLY